MSLNPKYIKELAAQEKILSFSDMTQLVWKLKLQGITVVLAQGVFDIVHLGHVGYLRAARDVDPENGLVIIGVENDESVRRNKGDARPINPAYDRMHVLAEFMSTGLVFQYEDTAMYNRPQDYIKRYELLSPAAIVVPTWDSHRTLKEWQAQQAGTQLALVNYQYDNSTTQMLKAVGYE